MSVTLNGRLLCRGEDLPLVQKLLPEHIRLSRAEPGCLSFAVIPSPVDPLIYEVAETFSDRAAFDAHQSRTRASVWGRETAHIPRSYEVSETPGIPNPQKAG
jgi:quinol monooxygenase YgiN